MTAHDEQLSTITDIMRSTRIASLAYVSRAGDLVSTPMGTQDFDEPGTIWFITERATDVDDGTARRRGGSAARWR